MCSNQIQEGKLNRGARTMTCNVAVRSSIFRVFELDYVFDSSYRSITHTYVNSLNSIHTFPIFTWTCTTTVRPTITNMYRRRFPYLHEHVQPRNVQP